MVVLRVRVGRTRRPLASSVHYLCPCASSVKGRAEAVQTLLGASWPIAQDCMGPYLRAVLLHAYQGLKPNHCAHRPGARLPRRPLIDWVMILDHDLWLRLGTVMIKCGVFPLSFYSCRILPLEWLTKFIFFWQFQLIFGFGTQEQSQF
jgi:hypothetical protein